MARFKKRCPVMKCAKRVRTGPKRSKCVERLSEPRKVCFTKAERTSSQRAGKVRRAKRILRDFACKSRKAPKAACDSPKLKK